MSWTQKAYCSVDDVKAALGDSSTNDDDLLTSLIAQAQAWIDERLGFSFQTDGTASAPATRTYNGNGKSQLLIDRCLQVTSVTMRSYSVTNINGVLSKTYTDEDITADVVLGPANRTPGFILERLSPEYRFELGRRNILVSGVFGIDMVPGDISRACVRLAVHFFLERESGYQDKVGGTDAGYGVKTFRTSIPDEVCDIVDRRRHRTFRS